MEDKNMTALVSAFVRCYHQKNSNIKIYNDNYSTKIITEEEYNNILENMSKQIKFFNPNFRGNQQEAIDWIVNNQLAPSVIARSAFCKHSLDIAIKIGCREYLVYASGYDTSALNQNIKCFEIDKPEMIEDKINRLKSNNINIDNIEFIKANFEKAKWINNILNSSYNQNLISFNSLLGISYYLTREKFSNMIKEISNIICEGSSILFDFQTVEKSKETLINEKLAKAAGEEMKSKYTYEDIENILTENGLKIYEYLDDKKVTQEYFYNYNTLNPNNRIIVPKGVAYILAIKK